MLSCLQASRCWQRWLSSFIAPFAQKKQQERLLNVLILFLML
jgi:hypothetical protein